MSIHAPTCWKQVPGITTGPALGVCAAGLTEREVQRRRTEEEDTKRESAPACHCQSAAQKKLDLFEEAIESRLMLQEQMVLALEGDEVGAGNARS